MIRNPHKSCYIEALPSRTDHPNAHNYQVDVDGSVQIQFELRINDLFKLENENGHSFVREERERSAKMLSLIFPCLFVTIVFPFFPHSVVYGQTMCRHSCRFA